MTTPRPFRIIPAIDLIGGKPPQTRVPLLP